VGISLKELGVRGWGKVDGIWGAEVPRQGPGAEPWWGLGAKPPEAQKTRHGFCA